MANPTSSSAIIATGSIQAGITNANAHVMTSGGNSGLSISLHPLPILSISEHYTRTLLSHPSHPSTSTSTSNSIPSFKVVGALLGTQTGREVSIVNTFELVVRPSSGSSGGVSGTGGDVDMDETGMGTGTVQWVLDRDFLDMRKDQFKEVFPTLDLVGWYTVDSSGVGSGIREGDVGLHAQFQEIIETPLVLLLTPPGTGPSSSTSSSSDLPLKVYESALGGEHEPIPDGTAADSSATTAAVPAAATATTTTTTAGSGKFVELAYTIETGEAERIAVDGAAKAGGMDSGDGVGSGSDFQDQLIEHTVIASLTTQRNAINMLFDRMNVMLEYVRGVIDGTAQVDHAILREISATIATLPAMDEDAFKEEYMIESNDVELTAYLAELTKGLAVLNDIADKASTINSKLFEKDGGNSGMHGFGSGGGGGGGGGRHHKTRAGRSTNNTAFNWNR